MVFAVVLLLLLIFVLQNGQRAEVSFFGAHGTLPMGVALLLAAVSGVLLVALPGTARIVQLRVLARRRGRPEADAPEHRATPPPSNGIPSVPLPPRPERQDG
ncbi:LapA family protein [Micromonospora phaseoli]|uniref:LapA family protein n=1 Tax=Micromonospora phaseoli TaxID=1144548 RepID=UPI0018E06FB8|nr:LapA family protein [Micromonospora phaseoli]